MKRSAASEGSHRSPGRISFSQQLHKHQSLLSLPILSDLICLSMLSGVSGSQIRSLMYQQSQSLISDQRTGSEETKTVGGYECVSGCVCVHSTVLSWTEIRWTDRSFSPNNQIYKSHLSGNREKHLQVFFYYKLHFIFIFSNPPLIISPFLF